MLETTGKKCVFFDRDGIVNESPGVGWVERWEDFRLTLEFVDVLRYVQSCGYEAVVITNQSAVARGIMREETVREIHGKFREQLRAEHDLQLLDIVYCPHYRDDNCTCRKPKPGMLLAAAERHGIDLSASWMIGDQERDIEAGLAGGCRTILVNDVVSETKATHRVRNMAALKSRIAEWV